MPFNFLKNCRDEQPTPHQGPLFARIDEGLPNMFGSCIAVVPSISSRRARIPELFTAFRMPGSMLIDWKFDWFNGACWRSVLLRFHRMMRCFIGDRWCRKVEGSSTDAGRSRSVLDSCWCCYDGWQVRRGSHKPWRCFTLHHMVTLDGEKQSAILQRLWLIVRISLV